MERKSTAVYAFSVVSVLLAACAAPRWVDLTESGVPRVVLSNTSGLVWADEAAAYQEHDDVIVTGKLARQGISPVLGHVDVT